MGGSGAGDLMFGGERNDMLYGNAPNSADPSKDAAGNGILFGGTGNDLLYGGKGDDVLLGGTDSDHLHGGAGNDFLVFSHDNRLMDGGEGIDILLGAKPDDLLDGIGGKSIAGIELAICGDGIEKLTNLTDLQSKLATTGLKIADDHVEISLDDNFWRHDSSADENVFVHGTGDHQMKLTLSGGRSHEETHDQVQQLIVKFNA